MSCILLGFKSVTDTTLWDSFVPLMINRLILSLKRAGNPSDSAWGSSVGQLGSIRFARRTVGGSERRGDDIFLRNLSLEEAIYTQSYD